MGVIDRPINPICIALAAEATFVARSVDRHTEHLAYVIERAAKHKGVAFVEVFQNCNIFNDGAFEHFADRAVKDDRMVGLEHGKSLIFGKNHDKGIRLRGTKLEVVTLGNGVKEDELLVFDEHDPDSAIAYMLSRMDYPEYPVPVGVFRDVEKPTYDELLNQQIESAIAKLGPGDLEKLLRGGDTWVVE